MYRVLNNAELKALDALIDLYVSRFVETLEGTEESRFRDENHPLLKLEIAEKPEAPNLHEAIKIAVSSREVRQKLVAPNPQDRRVGTSCKSHQQRIPLEAYKPLEESLAKVSDLMAKASDFENLHAIIAAQAQGQNDIYGVGDLMVYDVALRVGLWMGDAYRPRQVYLHAHPLKSAKLLFHPNVKGTLLKSEFPQPFERLSCMEIENFMCVYHNAIRGVLAG